MKEDLGEQYIGAVIAYRPPHSLHKEFVLLKSHRGDWNFVKGLSFRYLIFRGISDQSSYC